MNKQLEVGIIGDYDENLRSHIATNEALNHAAFALSISVKSSWISTQHLSNNLAEDKLRPFHGLWCGPGDYLSMDGALLAIKFAREQGWPFIAT